MSEFATESGHWYSKDASPAHTQIIKSGKNKGKQRNTTLADAKKLGLLPSVTTLMNILDKPALNHWKINKAVEKALHPDTFQEDTSAEEGTRIHGIVEHYILTGKEKDSPGAADYISIIDKVFEDVGVLAPDPERCFAANDYAGTIDLIDRDNGIIIDFKTKDLSFMDVSKGKKLHYDEHAMQLAAYMHGEKMQGARCFNLFLSRSQPDAYVMHEWSQEDMDRAWMMFYHTKELWYATKKLKREVT